MEFLRETPEVIERGSLLKSHLNLGRPVRTALAQVYAELQKEIYLNFLFAPKDQHCLRGEAIPERLSFTRPPLHRDLRLLDLRQEISTIVAALESTRSLKRLEPRLCS